MRIRWEVGDGYVGKSRPHYLDIPDEEFDEMSDEEKTDLIDDYVQQDFDNKVDYSWEIED